MKPNVILLVYGEGGHHAQMNRLLQKMMKNKRCSEISFIGLCENGKTIYAIENFSLPPIRDKYSFVSTIVGLPGVFWHYFRTLKAINNNYHVCGVISTGPGISILPSIYFKLRSRCIIFIETWSRFDTQSMTGRVMYQLADRFYVQNQEQLKFYPKALYGGLL